MKIDPKTFIFTDIDNYHSPNFDERPDDEQPSLCVVHGISLPPGKFGSTDIHNLFMNKLDPSKDPYFEKIAHLKVSPHLFINRKGVAAQYVPFSKRAWHAGVSSYADRTDCNDFSIGIELEGTDDMPYTDLQYAQLALRIKQLIKFYPSLSKDNIVGHSDIAPGRKTDPGKFFDWNYFQNMLTTYLEDKQN